MSTLKMLCEEGYIEKGTAARNGYRIIKLPSNQTEFQTPVSLVQFILPFKGWNYVGNQLLTSVEKAFAAKNCSIIFSNNNNSIESEQKLLQSLITVPAVSRPKALLLMPSSSVANPNTDLLRMIQQHMPVILVDRYIWGFDSHYVGLSNQSAGRIALDKFYYSGHKTVAFVGGFSTISPVIDRMNGFLNAANTRGLSIDQRYIFCDAELDLGFLSDIQPQLNNIGEKLLELSPLPTGIFCSSDRIAAALTNFFLARGYSVPKDFAIIGCDNDTDLASACPLPLSSFSHPFSDITDTLYQLSNNLKKGNLNSYYNTEYAPTFIPGKTWK